ncbi:MAG TPA: hypothetical protein PLW49_02145 [bacterium]|nr:hypothetical protein [bacterium]
MLILGIILTILGVIIFQWSAKAMSEPFYNRPLIFYKTIPVLIINLLWISLLAGGLYSFWQVSYKIVLFLVSIFAILWIVGYFFGSDKNKAKKFFQIYKQLKLYRPQTKEEDILRETARLYFQNLRWDIEKINSILKIIFDEKDREVKDVKDLFRSVLIFENPSDDFGAGFNFEKYMKESSKKDAAIEWAYKKVFGEQTKVTERPVLSEDTLRRMRESGLNPDEMSNEQLAALEGMENVEKRNWLSKIFSYGSIIFGLGAIINLFTLDIGAFIFSGVVSLVLMYIGYRIQSRIASKKFYEASILKWSQDQQKKKDE